MTSILQPFQMQNPSSVIDRKKLDSIQRQVGALEKGKGEGDRDEQIWAVAEGFEEIFNNMLFKAMRPKEADGFLGESYQGKMYKDMFYSEISHELSKRHDGLGIARMVHDFLAGEQQPIRQAAISRTFNAAQAVALDSVVRRNSFQLPVEGRISSGFGLRTHPITGETQFHQGVDIAAPAGSPIKAIDDGVVVFAGQAGGYGNLITLQHDDGKESFYGHNQENLVNEGDRVRSGQIIGLVGSTGLSTGPHVHFEIHRNGEKVNPLRVEQVKK